tara:strand:+ start:305 stop:544 length:240 start_codon:yes stop_codon:yes gene_type:complete
MSIETKNTEKGDGDRSNKVAWDNARYWSKESIIKRMIAKAELDGWKDIHGGDTGAYWRGIHPDTNKVEKLPKRYTLHIR